jgi:hypothetical protein
MKIACIQRKNWLNHQLFEMAVTYDHFVSVHEHDDYEHKCC